MVFAAMNDLFAIGFMSESILAAATLLFNPIKLGLLIAWVYLCFYCVQKSHFSSVVPHRIKPIANVLTLLFGPLVLLAFLLIDVIKKYMAGGAGFIDFIKGWVKEQIANIKISHLVGLRGKSSIMLLDSRGRDLSQIYGKDKKVSRHTLHLTEQIVLDAIDKRASDILIDPRDYAVYTLRFRIDGMLRTIQEIDSDTSVTVINSIKAISGMDISEKRRPQDGAFVAKTDDRNISFRVASAGVLNGEKISIRVLDQKAGTFALLDIGLSTSQYQLLFNAVNKQSGMILVCGPTGSGKTTTIYSLLNCIDFYTRNVITIEDPIEYVLPNASQIEINPKADITFAKTLRSVLRQDPDVVFVGEIRDQETAETALQASQTGHLVFSTLHSSSNASALVRLLDLGITPLLMSSGLDLLVSQRLLRKLCEHCKSPADLSISQMRTFQSKGIDPKTILKPNGCAICDGTGYGGRIGIYDIFVIDEKVRSRIAEGKWSIGSLKEDGDEQGISVLTKAGMEKVLMGTTSLEEVKRVVSNI